MWIWVNLRKYAADFRNSGREEKVNEDFLRCKAGVKSTSPPNLRSGTMTCAACGATIAQVSGKSGGYYGCLGAAKGACDNKMLVRRKLAENVIVEAVRDGLSLPKHIRYVLKRVEQQVSRLYSDVPETIRLKETELSSEERRLADFVEFVGGGRGSRALAEAVLETERRVETLKIELGGLRRSREKGGSDDSSNSLRWWTRTQIIRPMREAPIDAALPYVRSTADETRARGPDATRVSNSRATPKASPPKIQLRCRCK
jgi:hypothetical protein